MADPGFLRAPRKDGLATTIPQVMYNTLARVFGTAGMDSPAQRAVVGALVGYALQAFLKPGISYYTVAHTGGHGQKVYHSYVKQWKGGLSARNAAGQYDGDVDRDSKTTWFPWWMFPLTFGTILGVFI